jgi:hypothetical protein
MGANAKVDENKIAHMNIWGIMVRRTLVRFMPQHLGQGEKWFMVMVMSICAGTVSDVCTISYVEPHIKALAIRNNEHDNNHQPITMMFVRKITTVMVVATSLILPVMSFTSPHPSSLSEAAGAHSRGDFISSAVVAVASAALVVIPLQPANARGRATLEAAYDRYTPRIIDGGKFFKGQLYGAIAKSDWKSIETATAEPPKKSKEDRALPDGGIAKRAAQAGAFSDSRVLSAMDLFAATFSESSISPKTKAMQEEVAKLRDVVQGLNKSARIAQGEEKAGGGFFGVGGKTPSKTDLATEVKDLYMKGGNAFNQYVYIANDGLPVQLNKLPFL